MVHKVKGVVAKSKGDPVAIEMIEVPNPGPGEVLIDVKACGVCHTDLHYREGAINDEFPFLLGHEAAGIVEEVGEVQINSFTGCSKFNLNSVRESPSSCIWICSIKYS